MAAAFRPDTTKMSTPALTWLMACCFAPTKAATGTPRSLPIWSIQSGRDTEGVGDQSDRVGKRHLDHRLRTFRRKLSPKLRLGRRASSSISLESMS